MTVTYGRGDIRTAVEEIASAAVGKKGTSVLFVGGTSESRREALAEIAKHTSSSIYQHDAESLIGDSMLQTQGNIRETFDSAVDGTSLLYIDHADAVIRDARKTQDEDDLNPEAQTSLSYLLQRIRHFAGITVLHVNDREFLEAAGGDGADFIIEL